MTDHIEHEPQAWIAPRPNHRVISVEIGHVCANTPADLLRPSIKVVFRRIKRGGYFQRDYEREYTTKNLGRLARVLDSLEWETQRSLFGPGSIFGGSSSPIGPRRYLSPPRFSAQGQAEYVSGRREKGDWVRFGDGARLDGAVFGKAEYTHFECFLCAREGGLLKRKVVHTERTSDMHAWREPYEHQCHNDHQEAE